MVRGDRVRGGDGSKTEVRWRGREGEGERGGRERLG